MGPAATGALAEALLDRSGEGDVEEEAEAAIDRLAAAPADDGLVIRDPRYFGCGRCRCGYMVTSLGFEGHMKWAEWMP